LWRFYTLFLVVGLGLLVAVRMYGAPTVRMVLRTIFRRKPQPPHPDPDSAGSGVASSTSLDEPRE
ncbi:MAG TPA: hypothetical protein VMS76_19435, partial [Planctomycetota bacterium]|nr:hypothetical protein [Planctomycetota bacterium]